MTAGWPRPGGVLLGSSKDKLPRLDHPVVSARTNPQPRPASPQSVPANAPISLLSQHVMQ